MFFFSEFMVDTIAYLWTSYDIVCYLMFSNIERSRLKSFASSWDDQLSGYYSKSLNFSDLRYVYIFILFSMCVRIMVIIIPNLISSTCIGNLIRSAWRIIVISGAVST